MPSPELGLWLPNHKPQWGPPVLDHADPYARGLISAYALTEGAGTLFHDALRANPLSSIGTTKWIAGPYGPAFATDGGSGSAATNTACVGLPSNSSAVSVLLKAYLNPSSTSNKSTVLSMSDTVNNFGFNIDIHATAGAIGVYSSNTGAILLNSTGHSDGWYDLAYAYDGATDLLYLNGAQVTSGTATHDGGGTVNRLAIGRNTNTPFPETIDSSVRIVYAYIWGRALSAAEVVGIGKTPWRFFREAPQNQALFFMFSGAAGTGGALAGEIDGIGTAAGTLGTAEPLVSALAGTGSVAGSLGTAESLSASVAGIGTVSGNATTPGALGSSVDGTGTITGTLAGGPDHLATSVDGTFAINGAYLFNPNALAYTVWKLMQGVGV